MRPKRRQRVADQYQSAVEKDGARGGDVGDGLDEGGGGFVDEFGEGRGEEGGGEVFLGGPDGGAHGAGGEGDAVSVVGGVG